MRGDRCDECGFRGEHAIDCAAENADPNPPTPAGPTGTPDKAATLAALMAEFKEFAVQAGGAYSGRLYKRVYDALDEYLDEYLAALSQRPAEEPVAWEMEIPADLQRQEAPFEQVVWQMAWTPRERDEIMARDKRWRVARELYDRPAPASSAPTGEAVRFDLPAMQAVNAARSRRWMGDSPGWTILEVAGELAGEVGELANVCKKLRRSELGVPGNKVSDDELREQARRETGDVLIVLLLVASKLGIDIAQAAADVFNAKSVERGFPERFPVVSGAPHPDTIRLDWLERRGWEPVANDPNWEGRPGDQNGVSVFSLVRTKQGDQYPERITRPTLRQAIDAASRSAGSPEATP